MRNGIKSLMKIIRHGLLAHLLHTPRLTAIAIAVIAGIAAYAQEPADTVKVAFRVGESRFDPGLDGNGAAMDRFIMAVKQADAEKMLDSIIIRGYASPDGTTRTNALLSRQRGETVADLIARRSSVDPAFIHTLSEGIAWNELRRLVAATPGVPARERILDILDNTPTAVYDSKGKLIDGRKKQLMDLQGGRPYRWMLENLFPQLRNTLAVTLVNKPSEKAEEPAETIATEPLTAETEEKEPCINDTTHRISEEVPPPAPLYYKEGIQRFALKTNLLYYGILMPNIELEWRINRNWSVAVDADVAWWSNEPKHKCYRVAYAYPEVKYWINPRGPWHGMNVGVFAGGGRYDLENGGKGYQGEGGFAGASFGYMFPVSRYISFEAGIGVGFLRTNVKEYIPADGHYVYQRTKMLNYFGPLKLKFSLVWRFARTKDKNQPVK